jgi:glycerol kinase
MLSLMQLQADYLGVDVVRPRVIETTSAGAAFFAGHGAELFEDLKDIQAIWRSDKVFKPKMTASARDERMKSWALAIQRARL